MQQEGGPNYTIEGSHVEWDMWRFNYRVDKRPGLVVSNIDVNNQGTWRSVSNIQCGTRYMIHSNAMQVENLP